MIPTLVTIFNSSIVSAIGNLIVAYVFYTTRQLWQRKHIFTINLTILNLLIAIIAIPCYFVFLLSCIDRNCWCILGWTSFAIHCFSFNMTIINVTLISYQRFFSVLYPYHYQVLLTLERHVYIAIASWIYGAILTLPTVVESKFKWKYLKPFCFASNITLVIHITVMVFCYGRMGYIASRHRKKISHNSKCPEKLCKATKTSIHLVGTLLVSTLPWLGLDLTVTSRHPVQVHYLKYGVFYTSCFLNLFLYTLKNEDVFAVVKRKVKRKVKPIDITLTQGRTTNTIRPYHLTATHSRQVWSPVIE